MLLLTGLVAAASFCPSPAVRPQPLAAVQSVHAPAVVAPRCVAPRASASGDGDGEHWSPADDMALQDYINLQLSSAEAKCGPADRILAGIEEVWVLIFNVGKRNEGVYTLQGRETPYVLGFERMTDADRFAQALQVDFDFPTPIMWQAGQLASFCQTGGFEVSLVPMGAQMAPPAKNEYDDAAFDRIAGDAPDGLDDEISTQRLLLERMIGNGNEPPNWPPRQ